MVKDFVVRDKINTNIKIHGFDISSYALNCALDGIKENLFIHKAQEIYPFSDMEFDLAISLGCLHNLYLNELKIALNEITEYLNNHI